MNKKYTNEKKDTNKNYPNEKYINWYRMKNSLQMSF